MTAEKQASLDAVLDRLEQAIGRLADGRAPLEQVVGAYEEAHRLAREAEGKLEELAARLSENRAG